MNKSYDFYLENETFFDNKINKKLINTVINLHNFVNFIFCTLPYQLKIALFGLLNQIDEILFQKLNFLKLILIEIELWHTQ